MWGDWNRKMALRIGKVFSRDPEELIKFRLRNQKWTKRRVKFDLILTNLICRVSGLTNREWYHRNKELLGEASHILNILNVIPGHISYYETEERKSEAFENYQGWKQTHVSDSNRGGDMESWGCLNSLRVLGETKSVQ